MNNLETYLEKNSLTTNTLSINNWKDVITTTVLTEKEVQNNLLQINDALNLLIEDDAFNGLSDEMGGEFNFTEVAKTPSEVHALIEKVMDLNRRFANDRKALKKQVENDKLITTRLQLEQLLKDSEPRKKFDYVSFLKDNEIVFGIVREEVSATNGNFLSVIPFFKSNENDNLELIRNTENILIPSKEVLKSLDQDEGLKIWKDLMVKEKVNPDLEVGSKLKEIISPKINQSISNKKFSLKSIVDSSIKDSQSILKGVGRNANFEDILQEVFVSAKKSAPFQELAKSAVYKMFAKTIEDDSKPLKEKMNALVQVINDAEKENDLKFIDAFSHKFKNGELTDNDLIKLVSIYQGHQGGNLSESLTEFVELKKQELSNSQSNLLSVNNEEVLKDNVVAFKNNNQFLKGRVEDITENSVKIKTLKNQVYEVPRENIVKLFQGQKYTVEQAETLLEKSSLNIKWNDLSDESKISLLKGETTQLFRATHIKEDTNGFKEASEKEFKLQISRNKNGLNVNPVFKNTELDFDNFELHGNKLTEEQKEELKNNKVIVFEVFDKNGTLQFSTDMKYDSELNDIFYDSNKGKNFGQLQKSTQNKYVAKTTIVDKGKGMKM